MSKSLDQYQQGLAEDWDRRGRPDCTHDEYERHRILGQDTGDYICKSCGAEWWRKGPPPGPQSAAMFLDPDLNDGA
jgi:hypothetical protein